MNIYQKTVRPILFSFNAETAHKITFAIIQTIRYLPFGQSVMKLLYCPKTPALKREVFGLEFKNPVGIAAGLDKNGEYYNDLACFGASFIEIGSLTTEPQNGNPKPRLFRLIKDKAIINRMGINNKGVRYAISNLKNHPPKSIIVAASLSKQTIVLNENAPEDLARCYSLIYDFSSFTVINISCPNVEHLTELQDASFLTDIMNHVIAVRRLNDEYRPILVKITADLPKNVVDDVINICLLTGIDGIVASNTTRSREGLTTSSERVSLIGNGGLSGAPLFERALELVSYIHQKSNGLLPIIGVGGIMTPQQAQQMLDAGASLIEVYTGFIYNGPAYIKRIVKHLNRVAKERRKKENRA